MFEDLTLRFSARVRAFTSGMEGGFDAARCLCPTLLKRQRQHTRWRFSERLGDGNCSVWVLGDRRNRKRRKSRAVPPCPRRPGIGIRRASGEAGRHLQCRAHGGRAPASGASGEIGNGSGAPAEARSSRQSTPVRRRARVTPAPGPRHHHWQRRAQMGQPRAQLSDARSTPCSPSSARIATQHRQQFLLDSCNSRIG
jgi:hypothetical protein